MFMGFTKHIYIIFRTNLLTGGPAQNCYFFCLFQYFKETEYQTESKRNKTFGNVIFSPNVIQETWTLLQGVKEEVTRVGEPPGACPAPLPLPRDSSAMVSKSYVCLLVKEKSW